MSPARARLSRCTPAPLPCAAARWSNPSNPFQFDRPYQARADKARQTAHQKLPPAVAKSLRLELDGAVASPPPSLERLPTAAAGAAGRSPGQARAVIPAGDGAFAVGFSFSVAKAAVASRLRGGG